MRGTVKRASKERAAPELRLLGGLTFVGSDGAERPIRAKKSRALLAKLATSPGREHGREELAALLWGDMSEARARHNLRQCVSALRKDLGGDADVVVSTKESVSVPRGALEVDVLRLELLGRSEDAAALEAACELARGELLAGLELREDAFDAWLGNERRRLGELAGRALVRSAEAVLGADPDRAIELARRRLEGDPACEEAHRAIMRAHLASGRRSEVVAQFRSCEEALSLHLGVAPDARTRRLLDAMERAPAPRLTELERPAVAVLPFDERAGNERVFGDGLAEELVLALSRFECLFVIARESSFRFRDEQDLARIGEALGVGYVVRGTIRTRDERVRVHVSLVAAPSGETLFAERYERSLRDLFEVEEAIAHEVVATLVNRVEADRLARARRAPTESLAAFECFLRGRDHHHRYSAADNVRAQDFLRRAIELDPSFAAAHAWMACALAQSNAFTPDPGVFERAYVHVLRAHELDDGASECHRILASYYLMRKRFDDAERHQRRALALNPNDDRIVCQMGELSTWLGRPHEALPWIERAMRLNPFHADTYHHDHARALHDAGRHEEAVAALRCIAQPRLAHRARLVAALFAMGQANAAAREAQALRALWPRFDCARFAEGLPYRDPVDAARLREQLEGGLGLG